MNDGELYPCCQGDLDKMLGVTNLAFVMAVDLEGNVTLHPTNRVHASVVPDQDLSVNTTQIIKNVPGSLLVFRTNPVCIRMTLGGRTTHYHPK